MSPHEQSMLMDAEQIQRRQKKPGWKSWQRRSKDTSAMRVSTANALWGLLLCLMCSLPVLAADNAPLSVSEPERGIFVHMGVNENASADNLGVIANIGFIVGSKCVAIIDTGGTFAAGQALRAAVRQVTSRPVCYVINTHMHPDHIFGNAAFKQDHPVFIGHAKLAAAMAARGSNYLNAVRRDLGSAATGTEIIVPQKPIANEQSVDLGDRILRLRAWPTAHTDNDLTVYDEKTKTLWLSDLLFVERIPVVDGSLKGWLAAIKELQTMKVVRMIPGHGDLRTPWMKALAAQQRYLTILLVETRRAIKSGKTLQQATESVALSERGKWLLFDSNHRRNVTAAYAELEWEE